MTTINDRVERRIRSASSTSVITDTTVLDPTNYQVDVQGRGPLIEQLLDVIDPVLSGVGHPSAYVWGPKGAGKSTILAGIARALRRAGGDDGELLYTSTRASERPVPLAAYLDLRGVNTDFGFYRELLAAVDGPDEAPANGVSTETLRTRVRSALGARHAALIVTDHVDDPLAPSLEAIDTWLDALETDHAWIAAGRDRRPSAGVDFDRTFEVPAYRHHTLVTVLTGRADAGLTDGSVTYEHLDAIAAWADGDAHDALGALFVGATIAERADRAQITDDIRTRAIDAVPRDGVSLHRVFALPEDRRELLYRFSGLPAEETAAVRTTAEALAAQPDTGLQTSTITRILYELTDYDILRKVDGESDGRGRPPSSLEPRFALPVFRELHCGST